MTALAMADNWGFYVFGLIMFLFGAWLLWVGRDA